MVKGVKHYDYLNIYYHYYNLYKIIKLNLNHLRLYILLAYHL